MTSLAEPSTSRAIGIVESVSAKVIEVLIHSSAPHATALNTGTPVGFPRINGYLLVPNESGATVCIIASVQIDRQSYQNHKRTQDKNLIDLPLTKRLAKLIPLGTLISKSRGQADGRIFKLQRGVDVFPSIGDPVLLPTHAQLRAVVGGENSDADRQVEIGICPTAAGIPVHVNPDKLFGRHLAVLGNTGAGKSCTIAGLIHWSIKAAKSARNNREPNARFIILDLNGEYTQAFKDFSPQVFKVEGGDGTKALKVPAWLWNGEEWAAFTDAAPKVQQPILFDAIRQLRSGAKPSDIVDDELRTCIEGYHKGFSRSFQAGDHIQTGKKEGVALLLENLAIDLDNHSTSAEPLLSQKLPDVAQNCRKIEEGARGNSKKPDPSKPNRSPSQGYWHEPFKCVDIKKIIRDLEEILKHTKPTHTKSTASNLTVDENTPKFFSVKMLPDLVTKLAENVPGSDASQFVETLKIRIRGMFATKHLASITDSNNELPSNLKDWLEEYLGTKEDSNSQISVLDLSLVPSEVVRIVVAVLARMLFEALKRYRENTGSELPTILILDEAHTFVHREFKRESATKAEMMCCRMFERIAREGRKFGLGLVLASQRPSDMSPTVLSQCNTFLLHRIVNDKDQDQVRSIVPDGLGDLLRELPSLPSKRAILLGWGAPIPLLAEIHELPYKFRPHSHDPKLWDFWTQNKDPIIDWEPIADEWESAS